MISIPACFSKRKQALVRSGYGENPPDGARSIPCPVASGPPSREETVPRVSLRMVCETFLTGCVTRFEWLLSSVYGKATQTVS